MPGSVVITGGRRGVGRDIAETLLARGLAVTVLDVRAPDWKHDRLTVVVGDAADPGDVSRAAAAAVDAGPLVGWVNNAAVLGDGFIHGNPEAVLETIAATLVPTVVGTAEAVNRFLAAGSRGAIVNVSSHQAQRPTSSDMAPSVAKAALEALTRATAADYAGRGIRANAVALGPIDTEHDGGEATDVAETVAWLLSNPASFVTGAVLP